MNILKIIEIGLIESGYDGLYYDGCCACEIGCLSPGACLCEECTPGYKHIHSENKTWVIHKMKSPIADEEIEDIINETS